MKSYKNLLMIIGFFNIMVVNCADKYPAATTAAYQEHQNQPAVAASHVNTDHLLFPDFYHQAYYNVNLYHYVYFDPNYLRILEKEAEAALKNAEAKLETAKAKGKLIDQQRQIIEERLKSLRVFVDKLDQQFKAYERQQQYIAICNRKMAQLTYGKTADKENIRALQFMMRLSGLQQEDLMAIKVGPFDKNQFKLNRKYIVADTESPGTKISQKNVLVDFPSDGFQENAASYLEFLQQRGQDPRPGTPALQALIDAVQRYAETAQSRNADLEKKKQALQESAQKEWDAAEQLIKAINESIAGIE